MASEKIEQAILYDNIKYNYYTIDELNSKVITRAEILNEYKNEKKESQIFRNTEPAVSTKKVWKNCPENPGIEVSNFGRVKIDGEIWKQRDVKNKPGYLILDNFRSVPEKYKEYIRQFDYVYQLVARLWLGNHIQDGSTWDIHHISNKGHNNRPENLIWMRRDDHNKINHRA